MAQHRLLTGLAAAALVLTMPATALADDGTAPGGTSTPENQATATPSPSDGASPSDQPTPEGASLASGSASGSSSGSPSPSASESAANQPPETAPDEATVVAGESVTVDVLTNDSDDGQGRPDGEAARLEVTGTSGYPARVSHDADGVTFDSHFPDAGDYRVDYTVSDGELSAPGSLTVHVSPVPRSVSLSLHQHPVALRHYHLHGRVRPPLAHRAWVTIQRHTAQGWVRYRRVRTDPTGYYRAGFHTDRLGHRAFRAVATYADGGHARSGRLGRTVVARADVQVSGPLARRRVRYSWRPGCPVPPRDLRMIHTDRIGYDHHVKRGAIVVADFAVGDVVHVLKGAIQQRFPIRKMHPTEFFYAGGSRTPEQSDKAAMRTGNTSAFNCRPVTGNPYRISQHSYGNAVDMNTIRNPYVTGSRVYPSWARRWLDRSPYRKGMILPGGVIAKRMRARGWLWGARWSHPDYQHFSSNGG